MYNDELTHPDVRVRVLEAAAELTREARPHAAVDLFMTLLQDRLPTWVRHLAEMNDGSAVEDSLARVARSTISFFTAIQVAGITAAESIEDLVRLRRVLSACDVGPDTAILPISRYLRDQQLRGRVDLGVDTDAAAELLIAACLQRAMAELMLDADGLPARDAAVDRMVRGLRLRT